MFSGSLDYTICSSDPDHYNRIYCNLITPLTEYTSLIVTSLTCNCDMIVLNENDFIEFEIFPEKFESFTFKYIFNRRCKAFDRNSVLNILQRELTDFSEDISQTIKEFITSFNNNKTIDIFTGLFKFCLVPKFKILNMSYNVKLLTGFYNRKFPIESIYDNKEKLNVIEAKSVGFTMSTPILYLTSNVGVQSYRTNLDNLLDENVYGLRGTKIVLRINNSFISDSPIIVNNADFQTIIPSNDLSMLEFKLVDANMHEIELLSPMYITIHAESIKDEEILNYIMFSNEVSRELGKINQQNSNEVNEEQK